MKTTKVKGFTLIELIVVMAIFGIILFGAMNLLTPVSKTMAQSDAAENSNATLTSVTNYLEKSLSSAEIMRVYDYIPGGDPAAVGKNIAKQFAEENYSNLLKANTNPSDLAHPRYASGKVHVMMIDNSGVDALGKGNTHIREYTYKINNLGAGEIDPQLESSESDAINQAYYTTYDIQVKLGAYDDPTDTSGWLGTIADNDAFAKLFDERGVQFTVKADTKPKREDEPVYSFMKSTIFQLGALKDAAECPFYWVLAEPEYDAEGNETSPLRITSIDEKHGFDGKCQYVHSGSPYGVFDSYCLVYSYGAEIDTRK